MHNLKNNVDVSNRIILFLASRGGGGGISYNYEYVWSHWSTCRDRHNFNKIEDVSNRIILFACLQGGAYHIIMNMFGLSGTLIGTRTISRNLKTSQTESCFLLVSRMGRFI